VGTVEERIPSLRQRRTWHPNSSGDRWVLLQEVRRGSQTAGDLIQYRGGQHNPPITTTIITITMDLFLTTVQIDENPLIDITFMTDEELAALLEVTVDQLLEGIN
jgi:hypothetical protein